MTFEELVQYVNESDRESEFIIYIGFGGEENGTERTADKQA